MSEASRSLPRAGRDPEPAGRGARRRRRRAALSQWSRTRAGRRRLRFADRLDCGNVYARAEPTADGTPLFLCAHMDTVPPDGQARAGRGGRRGPQRGRHDPRRGQQGGGRGDARGRAARARREPCRMPGSSSCSRRRRRSGSSAQARSTTSGCTRRLGYVYDQEGALGEVVLGAPWSRALEVRFHGRSAHAGMAPEEGRSAIQAAAKAIADLRLGRVDELTTANVGTITGGTAGNVVPEWCTFLGGGAQPRRGDARGGRAGDARRVLLRRDRGGV